jgi:hypothetical protein
MGGAAPLEQAPPDAVYGALGSRPGGLSDAEVRERLRAHGANRLEITGVGILAEVVFSFAILYVEPVSRVLGTGPVDVRVYLLAWLGVPLVFGIDLLRKRLVRRAPAR